MHVTLLLLHTTDLAIVYFRNTASHTAIKARLTAYQGIFDCLLGLLNPKNIIHFHLLVLILFVVLKEPKGW